NRNYARHCVGRMKRPIGYGDDDIRFIPNQCLCQLRHLFRRAESEINDQIAAFDEAAARCAQGRAMRAAYSFAEWCRGICAEEWAAADLATINHRAFLACLSRLRRH